MNLEKEFEEIIDKVYEFSPYDTNRVCELARNNTKVANQCSKLSQDIAIKFGDFYKNLNKDNKEILRKNPDITTQDLFTLFLKDYENNK